MIGIYQPGTSPLHRLSPGPKLAALTIGGTLLFRSDDIVVILSALTLVLGLCGAARIPPSVLGRQLRPVLLVLAAIFAAQAFVVGLTEATVVVLRFAVLILAAALTTLTTRTSDMVAAIECALRPLGRWISVPKVSLALAMAIRFVPLIAEIVREVREAQRVRGLERSILAVAMPVLVRTLKTGTEVADALDARSFGAAEAAQSRGEPR
ncbi:energy-coupling factor transporter transmembrane component T family protein [Minwuia thermotolerans]|uniref:Energy-coupling factor transporter transmembrane protein EcfT n=1 Tax=Minwuia thermotolerans TaxID=2056226 RepID=A0A2M9G5W2_9PROT|nr:energy-coupling factor transporter transmembrane protein EcfT [Minwuia thermotolerans]PJK31092.1 energy-coupling factor transporter transmembrane protein EcfT [Minwuia thermotolerans]